MDRSASDLGIYNFGPFQLDPLRRALMRDGARLKLAERLFDTLFYLVIHAGRVVERDELVRAVWGVRAVDDNNIAQAISMLRKVLQADGVTETFIVTAPGRGYRFAAPVTFHVPQRDTPQWQSPATPAIPATPATPAPLASPRSMDRWRPRITPAIALLALILAGTSLALLRLHTRQAAEAPAPFAPPPQSVAVLQFTNMTGDPGQTYISDGLSEQLIDALSRIDRLQVAARTSAFSFSGKSETIAAIGRQLNVHAVLEGSVRRRDAHLLITAQLINAQTGYHFWSKTYDRDATDIIAVQTEIAQAVAQSLEISLLGGDAAILTLGGTANPAAFDAYLRGVRLQETATDPAGIRAALRQLDAALAADPGFARALSARAFARARLADAGGITDPTAQRQTFADALADADRALALAPALAAAHSVRGIVLQWGFLDLQGDAAEQSKALDLGPGGATIERNYAEAAIALGQLDQAINAARRATRLDPMAAGAWTALAHAQYMARQYDDAVATIHHAAALTDAMPPSLSYLLGKAELMRGHPGAARAACAAAKTWLEDMVLAIAFHALGKPEDAAAHLAAIQARLHDAGAYNYAVIAAQWGQKADALHWLQTAWRLRDPGLADIKVNPMLDPIRGTPEFMDIEHQVLAPRNLPGAQSQQPSAGLDHP